MVILILVVGVLIWAGAKLLLNAWWNRWKRVDLPDGLPTNQPISIADEAYRWLDEQR
jgi:hypothetical protein